ncbi:MAG: DUF2254 domain-containing protein [Verrucomicrobiae bacterium]|nr:DUF2254 domain-containing protein [Verrucomicrobiae bacterium]
MKIRLQQLWISLRSSFWFIPALMVLGAGCLGVVLVELDTKIGANLVRFNARLFGASADGARGILTGVAGSMITVAGVTFSITIVALSLASSQYTSRVLRNFIRDRANQTVLGMFLSIFIYCLVVLRTIRGGSETFIPSVSVLVGIALGVVGIAFLIFFIHHITTSIQASHIICAIEQETKEVIDELYPEKVNQEEQFEKIEDFLKDKSWHEVLSQKTGYIQGIDREELIEWAEENNTIIRVLRGVGEFVMEGSALLSIANYEPSNGNPAFLNRYFGVAAYRTIEQDAAFGIRQLVDIALKALSPSVNDTTTAVTCIDYLGAILKRLIKRKIPCGIYLKNDEVRLLARSNTYQYFLDEAFHQIRQSGKDNTAVILRMFDSIYQMLDKEIISSRRRALIKHAHLIREISENNILFPHDRKIIQYRFQEVAQALRNH